MRPVLWTSGTKLMRCGRSSESTKSSFMMHSNRTHIRPDMTAHVGAWSAEEMLPQSNGCTIMEQACTAPLSKRPSTRLRSTVADHGSTCNPSASTAKTCRHSGLASRMSDVTSTGRRQVAHLTSSCQTLLGPCGLCRLGRILSVTLVPAESIGTRSALGTTCCQKTERTTPASSARPTASCAAAACSRPSTSSTAMAGTHPSCGMWAWAGAAQ
mmetsp:Transcript_30962/g.78303  ORF Transcript_30962/g.78303 Transcript_30962/m.78303 type:complete len:213 (+) Transcript_30962:836-1474(+)